jgi:hypothetical protein
MSVLGLAASARSCAPISPVPLCACSTLMPVSRVKAAAAASHQPASVLHSALTVPCAAAFCEDRRSRARAPMHVAVAAMFRMARVRMRFSSGLCVLFEGAG